MSSKTILLIFSAAALAVYGIWWLVTPHNFEQCVQKNMKDAQTDRAAAMIYRACETQHK